MNEISEWDTNHFGFKIAKMSSFDDIRGDLKRFSDSGVRLIIARVEASQYASVRDLIREGFEFMTTEVYYKRAIRNIAMPHDDPRLIVRPFGGGNELDILVEITRESFANYMSHYSLDPKLDRSRCADVYVEWIKNSCSGELADAVFVGIVKGMGIVGYMTGRKISDTGGEYGLGAVSPKAQIQRARVYANMMISLMDYFQKRGLKFMRVSTQVDNYVVQKIWIENRFEIYKSEYTFHKWFEQI